MFFLGWRHQDCYKFKGESLQDNEPNLRSMLQVKNVQLNLYLIRICLKLLPRLIYPTCFSIRDAKYLDSQTVELFRLELDFDKDVGHEMFKRPRVLISLFSPQRGPGGVPRDWST